MQGGEQTQRETRLPGAYLLATPIPIRRDGDGWAVPQLWGKDLLLHLPHAREFTLAAPVTDALPPGEPPMRIPSGVLRVVPLPAMRSVLGTLLGMPITLPRLWREIGRASIVHCGIGGWPIPFGWFVAPMAKVRGKFLVVVVESAAWRSIPASERGVRRAKLALKRWIYETLGRRCVRMADAAFFTHSEYQASFPPRRPDPAHVLRASWIDDGDILDAGAAARVWDEKTVANGPVRLAFVGRLTEAKGLLLLLEAVRRSPRVHLDVYGFGELEPACRDAAKDPRVRFMGTLPYGPEFFAAVRRYDALVVPSLTDEQPRIIYDAFSQAVPVLASATNGHRECITEGVNGRFFAVNDAAALVETLDRLRRDELRRLGVAGLAAARENTHQAMHQRRAELILRAMG